MRIVSLEPFITELVLSLGLKESLVGLSGGHDFSEEIGVQLPILTEEGGKASGLSAALASMPVDLDALRELAPDVVLTRIARPIDKKQPGKSNLPHSALVPCAVEEAALREFLKNDSVKLLAFDPIRLDDVYEMTELVGIKLGVGAKGRERSQRMKAQFMDWADNFYDRTKNKKVTFISSIDPFRLGGLWIPDMIQLTSAASQEGSPGAPHREISWNDIVAFRPDVIVVAPAGKDLKTTLKYFNQLSKLPNWEDIPAVKRGEVIFTDGAKFFYRPSPRLIDSMAVLVSAIAGFEGGYITERDTFYRLRWLELHRHKI